MCSESPAASSADGSISTAADSSDVSRTARPHGESTLPSSRSKRGNSLLLASTERNCFPKGRSDATASTLPLRKGRLAQSADSSESGLVLLPARCAEASAMTLTVALINCAASRSAPR
eukprot:2429865-Prymnesium_polylepis.2